MKYLVYDVQLSLCLILNFITFLWYNSCTYKNKIFVNKADNFIELSYIVFYVSCKILASLVD